MHPQAGGLLGAGSVWQPLTLAAVAVRRDRQGDGEQSRASGPALWERIDNGFASRVFLVRCQSGMVGTCCKPISLFRTHLLSSVFTFPLWLLCRDAVEQLSHAVPSSVAHFYFIPLSKTSPMLHICLMEVFFCCWNKISKADSLPVSGNISQLPQHVRCSGARCRALSYKWGQGPSLPSRPRRVM